MNTIKLKPTTSETLVCSTYRWGNEVSFGTCDHWCGGHFLNNTSCCSFQMEKDYNGTVVSIWLLPCMNISKYGPEKVK